MSSNHSEEYETWEQTKARLRDIGIDLPETPEATENIVPIKARYSEPVPAKTVPLYEVRKITLPVDPAFPQGKVVVMSVTKEEADWWLEKRFKTTSYNNAYDDSKTLVFYEKFLIGGTPRERSIYSNNVKACTMEFPDFGTPRRIQ